MAKRDPDQVVLKHIARSHCVDPYKLRMALRKAGLKPEGARWQWPSVEDQGYKKAETIAKAMSALKTNGRDTSI